MAKVGGISGDLVHVCSSETFNQLVWVTFRVFFPLFFSTEIGGRGKIALEMLLSCL